MTEDPTNGINYCERIGACGLRWCELPDGSLVFLNTTEPCAH